MRFNPNWAFKHGLEFSRYVSVIVIHVEIEYLKKWHLRDNFVFC